MSFSAPTNFSKPLLAIAIGVGAGLLIHTLRRSELPHAGDNIHHLPHGGLYKDGNKCMHINGPHKPSLKAGSTGPIYAVLILTLLIILSERFTRTRRSCTHTVLA
uniref:11 kDa protein n=1 Tax=White ash mosaic virus TaxID=375547 RepID=D7PQU9_9VIRU|nr:11 kDa protein [White ash mosaic virus]